MEEDKKKNKCNGGKYFKIVQEKKKGKTNNLANASIELVR